MRNEIRIRRVLSTGLLFVALLGGTVSLPTSATGRPAAPQQNGPVQVFDPVTPGVFHGDLRSLPRTPAWTPGQGVKEIPRRHVVRPAPEYAPEPRGFGIDPLLARELRVAAPVSWVLNPPSLNFEAQGYASLNPPDPVGDVGRNFYIQMINNSSGASFVIYDKADGSVEAGPTQLDSLASSGSCLSGYGDPIVLYDQLADRWFLSEFSSSGNAMCVYISQTSDPILGGWYSYAFTAPSFPDYPKYAVWPDAYYISTNESSPAVYALDREQMLQGGAASYQRFTATDLVGFGFQALTPSDLDGGDPPPSGAPNYFMRHRDTEAHGPAGLPTADQLEVWEFDVDWATPGNSTFTQVATISVSEFDSELCGFFAFSCFPQPGGGAPLDPLREVIMWRLAYRNFGDHEVLLGNFVTDVTSTDVGGIRWFELRKTPGGGAWSLYQEGTFAPGGPTLNNWMGSIAMDGAGNIGMGYNFVDATTYAGLAYTGRLPTDTLGHMPAGALTIVDGGGTNGSTRYGDYNSLNLDPADDCTFWFTGEYSPSSLWGTRIAKFKFDTCQPPEIFVGDEDVPAEPVSTH